jgi:glutamate N-acetyltransferase/amino-acid N-acetyltransferase
MTVRVFEASAAHSGLKAEGKLDVALVVSEQPCTAAGVFTTNQVKAAPVVYDQEMLANPDVAIRAVVTNAGNANACTGEQGLLNARRVAAESARLLDCQPDEVLVLSTGVIGVQLPVEAVLRGVSLAAGDLRAGGWDAAARAIMTTDTHPKIATASSPSGYTVAGIAKGAGMIAPNMATMLSIIVTDAKLTREGAASALRAATRQSFNRIVVDGDMSTNDTVLLLANGASGITVPDGDAEFQRLLEKVCVELAQAIVRDGEGATKFVTVEVTGAVSDAEARTVAQAIARSPLCKTAFYGGDPNWGRIVCAAGYAGPAIQPDRLRLWLLNGDGSPALQLVEAGKGCDYDEETAAALMQQPEWGFRLTWAQARSAVVWTCDPATNT